MSKARKILKPISVLYEQIVAIRNKMYDNGTLKSVRFDIPTIVVGNLSVGGTGKSPMIEYLIRLLKKDYKIAVLSRGYKRSTKGFKLANKNSSAKEIGDEPFQFYRKFSDILVVVDSNRVNGIQQLKKLKNPPELILLDDAYQHRKVQAGFNILLTAHHKIYTEDSMLPSGDLRENIAGAKRAKIVIVTKCPDNLSEAEQFKITQKLNLELTQTAYFTKIAYAEKVIGKSNKIALKELKNYSILLVTGIANTNPLTEFLKKESITFKHIKYKDHYNFTEKDLQKIEKEFINISAEKKIILTTEKDYVRTFVNSDLKIYYLPIQTEFLNFKESFNTKIKRYVEQSTRNR